MARKRKIRQIVYRSAVTGRFVSAAYAKRWPRKTIRHTIYERCPA
jgi:hypothetical protein